MYNASREKKVNFGTRETIAEDIKTQGGTKTRKLWQVMKWLSDIPFLFRVV